MDLLQQTKELCRIYDIKPARSKGQNFLIKEDIYDEIIAAAELGKDDTVLEVGPGLGFLTAKLEEKAGKVVAVELDDKLADFLKNAIKMQGIKNVEVVNGNILDFDLAKKIPPTPFIKGGVGGFKIVANLPYNITSIFLRKFLSVEHKPSMMVLMLQKEVAERICAKAGEMSLLAVSVQFYAEPKIVRIVPKNNFWPAPEVDSAIIKLTPYPGLSPIISKWEKGAPSPANNERGRVREGEFFRLVKIGFSAKRKMLKNNLANGFHVNNETAENWLKQAGFSGKTRAQELSVEDWMKLFGAAGKNML